MVDFFIKVVKIWFLFKNVGFVDFSTQKGL